MGYVKSRLRQHGILPESISWAGSEQTIVKSRSQILSSQEILLYVERFIIEQMGADGNGRNVNKEQKGVAADTFPARRILRALLPSGVRGGAIWA